jgi:hypothetical protein
MEIYMEYAIFTQPQRRNRFLHLPLCTMWNVALHKQVTIIFEYAERKTVGELGGAIGAH